MPCKGPNPFDLIWKRERETETKGEVSAWYHIVCSFTVGPEFSPHFSWLIFLSKSCSWKSLKEYQQDGSMQGLVAAHVPLMVLLTVAQKQPWLEAAVPMLPLGSSAPVTGTRTTQGKQLDFLFFSGGQVRGNGDWRAGPLFKGCLCSAASFKGEWWWDLSCSFCLLKELCQSRIWADCLQAQKLLDWQLPRSWEAVSGLAKFRRFSRICVSKHWLESPSSNWNSQGHMSLSILGRSRIKLPGIEVVSNFYFWRELFSIFKMLLMLRIGPTLKASK